MFKIKKNWYGNGGDTSNRCHCMFHIESFIYGMFTVSLFYSILLYFFH